MMITDEQIKDFVRKLIVSRDEIEAKINYAIHDNMHEDEWKNEFRQADKYQAAITALNDLLNGD